MQPEDFDLLSEIINIETMAVNRLIREVQELNRQYGSSLQVGRRFVKCVAPVGDSLSVTPGAYCQLLPDPAEVDGMLRVIDNTGEDYLYEREMFEQVTDLATLQTDLTVALSVPMKAALLQRASQRGVSMASLLREWIDEQLDLPVAD